MSTPSSAPHRHAIPRTVWALGFVSLFMDLSSELIHALLPIFLVATMGMSVTALGALEGAAEATTMIVKVFSGPLSDWLGQRKLLLLLGYGLAALTKPLFPLAGVPAVVVAARLLDRIGKGIRGAPRDALVADVSPEQIRGACFGLRQSMDTVGAVAGPLCAIALMFVFSNDIRTVLWFAVIPAFICVALLVLGVREPDTRPARDTTPAPFRALLQWRALGAFESRYWIVVVIGAAFSLVRVGEAFLVLRAKDAGFDLAWVPAVMVVMNISYTLSAYPAGRLSDKFDRRVPFAIGLALLIAADLLLGFQASALAVFCGVVLWGLHMGFTQGVLATMVADAAPPALRGTAFGIFNLVSGVAMLASGVLAGWLWDRFGAPVTFLASAAAAIVPLAICRFAPPSARATASNRL
ncbi:MFS transporter [Trinickia caryophylli]|uniref:Predicted arabinose efflux permease, MFS family n=1 Tax=Trinickia caryophylli TaxID=28094 RepID=A0A1X7D040_TRICW|nr:MFS transporter [Trinickia caryophylli]PMS13516.1 MFS transporter [Trinickia caryophylli]TRX13626.1 MFS transporter [Trinickia caryophylli]WQE15204.1 MFS transporter [Trinickia caryophylli]SMF05894.1 Predicted arabinose efflux permease, MFS family [Trinickia caryophylli]GLU31056.1 MFS transporter [Trinickia caryophylli]